MKYKDYYEILGISRDANLASIKKAYRKLAKKYHPDVSKESDAENHFKEIGEAYEVLKDSDKRKSYDQFGQNWKQGQDFTPPAGFNAGNQFHSRDFSSDSGFSDFFETLFGAGNFSQNEFSRGYQQQSAFPGQDQQAVIKLDLQDSVKGGTRLLTINTTKIDAYGNNVLSPCQIRVKIPKGITQGKRIRIKGYGSPGMHGGVSGDLFLEVQFNPHPGIEISGNNIKTKLILMPWEAALGTQQKITTLHGEVELTIPRNSKSGQKLRIKGKGIGEHKLGDHIVELIIQTPEAKTQKQQALYKQMATLFG